MPAMVDVHSDLGFLDKSTRYILEGRKSTARD
jgi:hypothetical protein